MRDIIEHLKHGIGKKDGIAGDEIGGEFHVGYTKGRYDASGDVIKVTLLDKPLFYSYVEIAREIREKFEEAINSTLS